MATITMPAPPVEIEEVFYPESDGAPMGETGLHVLAIIALFTALKKHFETRRDMYVAADMFLYYEEGNPRAQKAPDVMVIKGVDSRERRIFKIWDEGVPPCTIIEITSRSTQREDMVAKPSLYARLGVAEYFLFDPDQEYLDQQLIGYRLEDGHYIPLEPDENGQIASAELGVIFHPQGAYLRAIDAVTGDPILAHDEAFQHAEEQTRRAEEERRRAEEEHRRAEEQTRRAEEERRRAEAAEAELERLRLLLAQYQPPDED